MPTPLYRLDAGNLADELLALIRRAVKAAAPDAEDAELWRNLAHATVRALETGDRDLYDEQKANARALLEAQRIAGVRETWDAIDGALDLIFDAAILVLSSVLPAFPIDAARIAAENLLAALPGESS
jgi:hypothetical protein